MKYKLGGFLGLQLAALAAVQLLGLSDSYVFGDGRVVRRLPCGSGPIQCRNSRCLSPRTTATRLGVLTTPESIIISTSNQDLLDDLIDESTRMRSRRPIILQFDPTGNELWRKWRGTVFSESWRPCLRNMIMSIGIGLWFKVHPKFKVKFEHFPTLWAQLLSVTTFTLTFFLNVSYNLWRKCYLVSRRLQGRLNDLSMLVAAHADRTSPQPPKKSTFTKASKQTLLLISRYVRLFNLLTYASFTRSHRPILTPRGMRRLVDRGIITDDERVSLMEAEVPATQRHNAVLLWIMRVFYEGRESGHIKGSTGLEQNFLQRCHEIRAQYGGVGDELSGRMPLAYAHIVQVLVDVVLWLYPVMAFGAGMGVTLGVLGCGLLTLFYQGIFDLAKQFLDPYDNENYGAGDDPLVVDTLIAESNAGSVRWVNSFMVQPWHTGDLQNGNLDSYMRPERGYSVKELEEKDLEEKEELRVRASIEKEAKEVEQEAKFVQEVVFSGEDIAMVDYDSVDDADDSEEDVSPPDDSKKLSQQLAESVSSLIDAGDEQIINELPEALDAFSKKAEEALETAKAEMKETAAILNAAPLAESLDIDEEIEEAEDEEEVIIVEDLEDPMSIPSPTSASSEDRGIEEPVDAATSKTSDETKAPKKKKVKKDIGEDLEAEAMVEAAKSVIMATKEKEEIDRIESLVVESGITDIIAEEEKIMAEQEDEKVDHV